MWVRAENSDTAKPAAIERSGSHVIVRKNFHAVEATEERGAHWEFDEWQMTDEQYEVYQDFEGQITERDDALVELAELCAEQDDALIELAGLIKTK